MNTFKADDKNVRIIGRTVYRNGTLWLGYSCTAAEFEFTGKTVSAEITTDWINDEPWKNVFQPYLAVFINGDEKPVRRFPLKEGTNTYEIYSSSISEKVKIRIMKMSENSFSRAGIISLSADGEIKPTLPSGGRKIEFIGDSITCGFGDEGVNGKDNFSTATENPWDNYAALTARHFGAEFHLISWTSIGIISNSVEESVNEPADEWTMPKIYSYTDKGTENYLSIPDEEKELWDFGKFSPDLIVINLGTNDNFYTRGIPGREESFRAGCRDFIREVRGLNPGSAILYALGAMGQELCPQAEAAVNELRETDKNIFFMRFDVQREEDGIGAEAHPSLITHRKMSERLIAEIEHLKIFGS